LQRFSSNTLLREKQRAELLSLNLTSKTESALKQKKHQLQLCEKSISAFSPERMLERGFSLTLHEGRILRSVAGLPLGARLEARLGDGIIESLTERINKKDDC
jgi:exodeoxyribonuclease VII large subunit